MNYSDIMINPKPDKRVPKTASFSFRDIQVQYAHGFLATTRYPSHTRGMEYGCR